MPKVPCYLRTVRREWGLTQNELASFIPQCQRARVSKVERGLLIPTAAELIAYALLFARTPETLFPAYAETIEDAVMRGAAALDKRLEAGNPVFANRKREFLRQLLDRAP
jgi:transcriptional regulator with XRE-family HTH domain